MRSEYKQLATVVRDALGSMNKDISDVVHSAIGYGVATKLGEMDAVNNDYNTYVAPVDKIGYVPRRYHKQNDDVRQNGGTCENDAQPCRVYKTCENTI